MLDGNSAAELAHDLAQMRAPDPGPHMEDAREELIERLVAGEAVHCYTRDDVLAAAIDEPDEVTRDHVMDVLRGALNLNVVFRDDHILAAAELRDNARRFIERHVDAHADWIEERAAEIAREKQEESHGDD